MKTSDLLFQKKAELQDLAVSSMRTLCKAIYEKNPCLVQIGLEEYFHKGVCEFVGTWIMDNDGSNGEWGTFTGIKYHPEDDSIILIANSDSSERYDNAYEYYTDDLVYLYDELEKIEEYICNQTN